MITIIESDNSYQISVAQSDYKVEVGQSNYKIGLSSNSGYGIQGIPGIKGDKGEKGETGAAASVGDVTGLQAALDAKANVVHYHIVNDITDFDGTVFSGGSF